MNQILLAISTSLLLASCQRELSYNNPTPTPVTSGDALAALEQEQPAAQKVTISATTTSWVMGTKGTKIMVPSHAFVTQSGQPVTGNVTVELKEIYTVADMVLNNKFTQVGNMPLESGGELFIRATQNNQELKLASGVRLTADMPAQTRYSDMQVFNGSYYDSLGKKVFGWTLNTNSSTNNVAPSFDSLQLRTYIMQFDSVGWINCDRFINEPLVQAAVTITNTLPNEQSSMLLHFTGLNSIEQIGRWNDTFHTNTPERAVTLIAISQRNGKLYADFKDVQMQQGQTYSLTLGEMTEDEFKQKLLALK